MAIRAWLTVRLVFIDLGFIGDRGPAQGIHEPADRVHGGGDFLLGHALGRGANAGDGAQAGVGG